MNRSALVFLPSFQSEKISVRTRVKRQPRPPVLGQLDALFVKKQNEAKGPGLFIQLLNARGAVTVDSKIAQKIRLSANSGFAHQGHPDCALVLLIDPAPNLGRGQNLAGPPEG